MPKSKKRGFKIYVEGWRCDYIVHIKEPIWDQGDEWGSDSEGLIDGYDSVWLFDALWVVPPRQQQLLEIDILPATKKTGRSISVQAETLHIDDKDVCPLGCMSDAMERIIRSIPKAKDGKRYARARLVACWKP